MNVANKCKKPDSYSGHFVLGCRGWKCESYIGGLKTNRKKEETKEGKKKEKRKESHFYLNFFMLQPVVALLYEFRYLYDDPVKLDLLRVGDWSRDLQRSFPN